MKIDVMTKKSDEINPLEELHSLPEQSWQSWGSTKSFVVNQQVLLLLPALATQPRLIWVPLATGNWKKLRKIFLIILKFLKLPGTRTLKQLKCAANSLMSWTLLRTLCDAGVNVGASGSNVVGGPAVGTFVTGGAVVASGFGASVAGVRFGGFGFVTGVPGSVVVVGGMGWGDGVIEGLASPGGVGLVLIVVPTGVVVVWPGGRVGGWVHVTTMGVAGRLAQSVHWIHRSWAEAKELNHKI
jgi:hypothetical protein